MFLANNLYMFLTNKLSPVKSEEIELFKAPKNSLFLGLPVDVFELLISFFTPENFTRLTCCSRQARLLDKDDALWNIVRKHFPISENVAKLSNNPKKQLELQSIKNLINIRHDSHEIFTHYHESGKFEKLKQVEGWFSTSVAYHPIEELHIVKVNGEASSLRGLGLFQNLTFLNIKNGLNQIPNVIFMLKSLKILNLSHNQITKISSKIRILTQLQYLVLNNNILDHLPNSIGCLSNLRFIDLGKNRFQEFPQVLIQLKRLEEIKLNDNSLREIPESIALLKNMRKLNFNQNKIVEIPSQIGMLNLEELHLSSNKIKHLPISILQIETLIFYSFGKNPIRMSEDLSKTLDILKSKSQYNLLEKYERERERKDPPLR